MRAGEELVEDLFLVLGDLLVDDGFGLFWLIVIAGVGGSLLEPASAAALSALVDARVMARGDAALAGVGTDSMAEAVFDFADFPKRH